MGFIENLAVNENRSWAVEIYRAVTYSLEPKLSALPSEDLDIFKALVVHPDWIEAEWTEQLDIDRKTYGYETYDAILKCLDYDIIDEILSNHTALLRVGQRGKYITKTRVLLWFMENMDNKDSIINILFPDTNKMTKMRRQEMLGLWAKVKEEHKFRKQNVKQDLRLGVTKDAMKKVTFSDQSGQALHYEIDPVEYEKANKQFEDAWKKVSSSDVTAP